ncbi:hypothetical protein MTYP_00423 [Methylophilaceae bacterium]|nr:hypothetical protein MTYP_00423 [Methylophilaceae bacterium]
MISIMRHFSRLPGIVTAVASCIKNAMKLPAGRLSIQ